MNALWLQVLFVSTDNVSQLCGSLQKDITLCNLFFIRRVWHTFIPGAVMNVFPHVKSSVDL